MLTQPAPDCPGDGGLCPWLWEVTGQRWLAENSHLALVPLRILMIVVAAVALRWLLHRAVARLVRRSASGRSEEHTSELQSRENLVCRLLLEKKKRSTVDSPQRHSRVTS